MKRILGCVLALVLCLSAFSAFAVAADYSTFEVVISDNGDGTVLVSAYAPAGVYSGKLVLSNSDDLSYVASSAVYDGYLNDSYDKNGVKGVCLVFARSSELKEKTKIFSATYNVVNNAEITSEDIYSDDWNLTNGSEFVANQNNGPVDVTYVPKTYVVMFFDANDNLLKEETVVAGSDATAPVAPDMEGYDFVRWDTDYTNVNSDLVVKADYVIKMFTVTFTAEEGATILGPATITVPYGTSIDDLPFPEVELNFSGDMSSEWKLSEGEYLEEKGITCDITMLYTYEILMGPRPSVTMGDVNNDGYVDNIDATIILKYDAGIINELDYYLEYGGDVNVDLYIDNIDAALILKYDAGLIEGF